MNELGIKEHLRKYFEGVKDKLSNDFDISTGASGGHISAKGENREKILIDFLKKHIPARFSVEQRGKIFDHLYNVSKQIDIIIYDKAYPMLKQHDSTLYFIEGVAGCIEVKSTLNKKNLLDGIDNIASFKKLKTIETNVLIGDISEPDVIVGGIFAFKNELSEDKILKIISESNLENRLIPDFIYSNDGMCLLRKPKKNEKQAIKQIYYKRTTTILFYFLMYLVYYVSGKNLIPISLEKYNL